MGGPVFRIQSRAGGLDFIRDKVAKSTGHHLPRSGGFPAAVYKRRRSRDRRSLMSGMKILALELSTARGSLAWLDGEVALAREWPNDRKNSAVFFARLDAVTKKSGAPDTIIVGLGTGSFAVTRIAMSAAVCLRVEA